MDRVGSKFPQFEYLTTNKCPKNKVAKSSDMSLANIKSATFVAA